MKTIFQNPFINSVLAEAYIIAVVLLIHSISKPNTPDTFFDAIGAISLFVLSAAVMGFLFLGQPLQLYFDGEKKRAVTFFGQTILGFGVITIIAIVVLKFVG